jgi:hypothetical protein
LASVRRAKAHLARSYHSEKWFRGVGIAPDARRGFRLRIGVSPSAKHEAKKLPKMFEGFSLQVVYIDSYEPR